MKTVLYVNQDVVFEQQFATGSIDVTVKLKNNGLIVFTKPRLTGETGYVNTIKKCYVAPTSISDGMTIVNLQELGGNLLKEVDTMFETTLYPVTESTISKETSDIIDTYENTLDQWVQAYGLDLDWGEYQILKPDLDYEY